MEEEKEIQVWNFTVNDEEIEELISKLYELKETKKQVFFEIDEDNELQIDHEFFDGNPEEIEKNKKEADEKK